MDKSGQNQGFFNYSEAEWAEIQKKKREEKKEEERRAALMNKSMQSFCLDATEEANTNKIPSFLRKKKQPIQFFQHGVGDTNELRPEFESIIERSMEESAIVQPVAQQPFRGPKVRDFLCIYCALILKGTVSGDGEGMWCMTCGAVTPMFAAFAPRCLDKHQH